jgi:lipopolysaccharide transport system ATP-binding protein
LSKPSDSELLVSCQGISKKFCRNLKKSLWYGVKDGVSEIVRGHSSDILRKDEFWALDDVSFELRRGECLGLLGRNGAGKTTLLKVLSGLIKPDKGTITLKGKVGGLIALGAGFNGILSGRENIRINGSILGYSREEIEEKMQEIIDFAEIPDFIDAPVNTYSSGMSVRLGFAIAAILTKPDVLLLDEVLAVGDIGFTIKCLNAVREMMKNSAVIFVSHNLQFISQFCTQVMLFESGKVVSEKKNVSSGISEYLCFFQNNYINVTSESVELNNFQLSNSNGSKILKDSKSNIWQINQGDKISLSFDLVIKERSLELDIFTYIMDLQSTPVICFNKLNFKNKGKNYNSLKIDLGILDLNSGRYSFTIGLVDLLTGISIVRMEGVLPFFIEGQSFDWGYINRNAGLTIS